MVMLCGFHFGAESSLRSSSGARFFTMILVSKSMPVLQPRYS